MQGVRQCVRSNFSCSGVVDAGTPPIDAGVPPPFDAGLPPPLDAGIPPLDAGLPPLDAGVLPDDAGIPPVDAGPPPPPCTEDSFDPNDSVAAAKPLALGYTPNLCALNDDFYSIAMDGTEGLRVELFFTNASGNLDLELIAPDGATIVAASRGQGNGEAISVNTLAAGTYTVRVFGRAGAQNKYSLQLSYVFIPQCIDDRQEPNDTPQAARTVRPGLQAGLQICANNDDYFAVSVAAHRVLIATAAFTNTAGNLDLAVSSPTGTATQSATNANIERVQVADTEAGNYVVRVWGRNGAQNSYTLNIEDKAGLCGSCNMDQDCGEQGARCIPLMNGSHCARSCQNSSQCPSGYSCFTQFGVNQCYPSGYRCP
jgi:hypothetical protein